MQFCSLDDGRGTRLKHVERLTEINKLINVASCWLYSENILAMHGPMNVKKIELTCVSPFIDQILCITLCTPHHTARFSLLHVSTSTDKTFT